MEVGEGGGAVGVGDQGRLVTADGEVVFGGGVALECGVTGNGEGVVRVAPLTLGIGDGLITTNSEVFSVWCCLGGGVTATVGSC